jgi:hypothetical protein
MADGFMTIISGFATAAGAVLLPFSGSRHSATIFLRIAYSLECGRVGVLVRAHILRCKKKEKLTHPTRFERVTSAFKGQG